MKHDQTSDIHFLDTKHDDQNVLSENFQFEHSKLYKPFRIFSSRKINFCENNDDLRITMSLKKSTMKNLISNFVYTICIIL